MSDATKAAKARYRKNKVWKLYLDFYPGTDSDIIKWLKSQPSKAGAVKEACRKQIQQCIKEKEICGEQHYVCPYCGALFDPAPEHNYCQQCGQSVRRITQKQKEQLDATKREYLYSQYPHLRPATEPETSAPVDTEPETSAPVDTEPETSAPVDNNTYSPIYKITYCTKKGGKTPRKCYVHAKTAKQATQIFREAYKTHLEATEGHAFQVSAKRYLQKYQYPQPELKGTEKQVTWAENIRASISVTLQHLRNEQAQINNPIGTAYYDRLILALEQAERADSIINLFKNVHYNGDMQHDAMAVLTVYTKAKPESIDEMRILCKYEED